MVSFSDVVKTKTSGCAKCFSMIYTLPCIVDRDLAGYLTSFGPSAYPLDKVRLLRINAKDGFHIEARINTKIIKFVMPKKFEKVSLDKIEELQRFEKSLAAWMSNKLNIVVEK
jgi:hypothetical protein